MGIRDPVKLELDSSTVWGTQRILGTINQDILALASVLTIVLGILGITTNAGFF